MNISNLTIEEQYRLTGTLTTAAIESLLDTPVIVNPDAAKAKIRDAIACYPAEDFLSDILNRLQDLAKDTRGRTRDRLVGIIESLDDLSMTTFYSTEHGRSELNDALTEISTQEATQ